MVIPETSTVTVSVSTIGYVPEPSGLNVINVSKSSVATVPEPSVVTVSESYVDVDPEPSSCNASYPTVVKASEPSVISVINQT